MKVSVIFYSSYGHIYEMAKAAMEGIKSVDGVEAQLLRVPETLSEDILEKTGALAAQKAFSHLKEATPGDLENSDGIIFGVSTRFGQMNGQLRSFLDSTGGLWAKGALIGKVGSAMASTATQHGGQENALISTLSTLMHHGMVIVGLPYSFKDQMRIDEITGGSPYGATTITGGDGERMPGKTELDAARFQGAHVARIAKKLAGT